MKKFFFRLCTSAVKGMHITSISTKLFKSMYKQFPLATLLVLSVVIIQCKKRIGEDSSYVPVNITCTLTKNVDSARILIQGKWN